MSALLLAGLLFTSSCEDDAKAQLREEMREASKRSREATDAHFWREEAGFKLDLIEAEVVTSLELSSAEREILLKMIENARRSIEATR